MQSHRTLKSSVQSRTSSIFHDRCLFRLLLVPLICLINLAFMSNANAGYYLVAYSNGSSQVQGVFGSSSNPYVAVGQSYEGSTSSPYGPCTASCSGNIIATFTWVSQNADLPPLSAVIYQDCTLNASSSDSASSLQADCGLPQAQIVSTDNSNSSSKGSAASFYWVKDNPGLSFTVPCSPTVSSTSFTPYVMVNVKLHYSAVAWPVVLNPRGTTIKQDDNSANILIGQGCKPQIGYQIPDMIGLTGDFDNFTWTIPGDIFKDFEMTQDLSALTPFELVDSLQKDIWFYWKDIGAATGSAPETLKVNATVYITVIDPTAYSYTRTAIGQVKASSIVSVWEPTSTATVTTGLIEVFITQPGSVAAGGGRNDPDHIGISWDCTALAPDLFNAAGHGNWEYVQTFVPGRVHTVAGVDHVWTNNMLGLGLDTVYPYPMKQQAGNTCPDDGTHGIGNDSPFTGISVFEVANNSHIKITDTFFTYMMYSPPTNGYGTKYVPLHLISWQWPVDQVVSNRLRDGQVIGHTTSGLQDHPGFPIWTQLLLGNAPYNPAIP